MKKNIRLFLCALFLCTALLLAACGGSGETSSTSSGGSAAGDLNYTVTVADPLGNPYSAGVAVQFLQNGEKVAMQACDENGTAVKTLAAGEYTVSPVFSGAADGYHCESDLTLNAEQTEGTLIVSHAVNTEPTVLVAQSAEYDAYDVCAGCTYVELNAGDRNYFLFTPTVAGNYSFQIVGDSDVTIGYYGAPHYVQENSVAEVTDNAFTVNVKAGMISSEGTGTTVIVIGIDAAENVTSCTLGITRLGDPIKSIEDEPWTTYQTTAELSEYQLPEGAQIQEFDLTASTDTYTLVFNEEDGFYHLDSADGPLVLVRLTEDCEYISCFGTILEYSGVSKYFFDENGTFVKKENYSDCLLKYIDYVDENAGVYPLTEDLKYIIQQRGDYVGWWDINSSGYLFTDINGNKDDTINCEIAWLLMCCYVG